MAVIDNHTINWWQWYVDLTDCFPPIHSSQSLHFVYFKKKKKKETSAKIWSISDQNMFAYRPQSKYMISFLLSKDWYFRRWKYHLNLIYIFFIIKKFKYIKTDWQMQPIDSGFSYLVPLVWVLSVRLLSVSVLSVQGLSVSVLSVQLWSVWVLSV